jgi:hypothetical protein
MDASLITLRMPLLLGIVAFLVTQGPANAVQRGKPGTSQRAEWCSEQRSLCEDDGYQNCTEKWGDSAARDTCASQTYDLCRITFGRNSRCMTQERVAPGALPETLAPTEIAPEKPPKPKLPMTSPDVAPSTN